MKSLKNLDGTPLEELLGYTVVDQNGTEVGSLHSLWSRADTGEVGFLGVKTGLLFMQSHVVPAENTEWDGAAGVVRLPYDEMFLKEAPVILADAELTKTHEDSIGRYFGTDGAAPDGADYPDEDAPPAAGEPADTRRWRRTARFGVMGANLPPAADEPDPGTAAGVPAEGASEAGAGESGPAAGADFFFSPEPARMLPGTGAANVHPVTGELGAHPVGAVVGALGAGLAGAAIGGAVGGPFGAPVGALLGALAGGLAGEGVAEAFHPTDEEARWQADLQGALCFKEGCDLSDYVPAFRVGYESFRQWTVSGRDFDDMAADLQREFERTKGASRLAWEDAKVAVRTAWARAKVKAAGNRLD